MFLWAKSAVQGDEHINTFTADPINALHCAILV